MLLGDFFSTIPFPDHPSCSELGVPGTARVLGSVPKVLHSLCIVYRTTDLDQSMPQGKQNTLAGSSALEILLLHTFRVLSLVGFLYL